MKRRLGMKTVIGFLISLSVAGLAVAGDTASVTVSCVVPLMPGLNAPLIEAETSRTKIQASKEQPTASQNEPSQPTPTLIQQDTQREAVTTKDSKTTVIVKTYYTR